MFGLITHSRSESYVAYEQRRLYRPREAPSARHQDVFRLSRAYSKSVQRITSASHESAHEMNQRHLPFERGPFSLLDAVVHVVIKVCFDLKPGQTRVSAAPSARASSRIRLVTKPSW